MRSEQTLKWLLDYDERNGEYWSEDTMGIAKVFDEFYRHKIMNILTKLEEREMMECVNCDPDFFGGTELAKEILQQELQ